MYTFYSVYYTSWLYEILEYHIKKIDFLKSTKAYLIKTAPVEFRSNNCLSDFMKLSVMFFESIKN